MTTGQFYSSPSSVRVTSRLGLDSKGSRKTTGFFTSSLSSSLENNVVITSFGIRTLFQATWIEFSTEESNRGAGIHELIRAAPFRVACPILPVTGEIRIINPNFTLPSEYAIKRTHGSVRFSTEILRVVGCGWIASSHTLPFDKITPFTLSEQQGISFCIIHLIPTGINKQSKRNLRILRPNIRLCRHPIIPHNFTLKMCTHRPSGTLILQLNTHHTVTTEMLLSLLQHSRQNHQLPTPTIDDVLGYDV
mmetsp:Transcript_26158/g.29964  ORF Transcript_26158/g.29964 Transcript_26158/m.29964 type:complete len:249 (-) Transcript_26158:720-1466(-)